MNIQFNFSFSFFREFFIIYYNWSNFQQNSTALIESTHFGNFCRVLLVLLQNRIIISHFSFLNFYFKMHQDNSILIFTCLSDTKCLVLVLFHLLFPKKKIISFRLKFFSQIFRTKSARLKLNEILFLFVIKNIENCLF